MAYENDLQWIEYNPNKPPPKHTNLAVAYKLDRTWFYDVGTYGCSGYDEDGNYLDDSFILPDMESAERVTHYFILPSNNPDGVQS